MRSDLTLERTSNDTRQQLSTETLAHRLSWLDRASLRLGLWLLLRSTRRIHRLRDHDAHAHRLAREGARAARDAYTYEHLLRATR